VAIFDGPHVHEFHLPEAGSGSEEAEASMRAPMPGLVKLVHVRPGQKVSKGQPLLVLEAMKMEHAIAAPREGAISSIVAEGAQVAEGTALVRYAEDAN